MNIADRSVISAYKFTDAYFLAVVSIFCQKCCRHRAYYFCETFRSNNCHALSWLSVSSARNRQTRLLSSFSCC